VNHFQAVFKLTYSEVFRCSEQARIENAGNPTFTVPEIVRRKGDVEDAGRRRAREVRNFDEQIVQLERDLLAAKDRRAHAARQVGMFRDMKADLEELYYIARARIHPPRYDLDAEDSTTDDSDADSEVAQETTTSYDMEIMEEEEGSSD
jgi:hypothetical protein